MESPILPEPVHANSDVAGVSFHNSGNGPSFQPPAKKNKRISHHSQRESCPDDAMGIFPEATYISDLYYIGFGTTNQQPDNMFLMLRKPSIVSKLGEISYLGNDQIFARFQLDTAPTLRWMPRNMFLCLVSRPVRLGWLYVGRCCCPLEL